MKVKMLTTGRGPNPSDNFDAGQVLEVSRDVAVEMKAQGIAEFIDPAQVEEARIAPEETATAKPTRGKTHAKT